MTSKQVKQSLSVAGTDYEYFSLSALQAQYDLSRLPYAAKILLENLLRHADQPFVESEHIDTLATWDTNSEQETEIAFVPSRVILQDFTGVPAIVDLATMRDAIDELGGDANKINPLKPVELVIDHSVMVDVYAQADAYQKNTEIEVQRNRERYQFLRWGQQAFDNLKVVPPGRGIVHQVNLEYLARGVFEEDKLLYPDTLVGTDSHTTMINGMGVLGWGVGGIEAEAAMLGQPISMLIPEVIGFEIKGELQEGVTATDLVLAITQQLREFGVVGKFVEFCGEGLQHLTLADRATIANMAPEYGATCGIFPIDEQTVRYLQLTGRDEKHIERIKAYCQAQDMWGYQSQQHAQYHARLTLDLSTVEPSIAGPKRPQDRIPLTQAASSYYDWLKEQDEYIIAPSDPEQGRFESEGGPTSDQQPGEVECELNGEPFSLANGAVVIAAITSCTNTSNPDVLVAAGLLAQNAVAKGLRVKPWVKTSFAPGSQVVTEYLERAGLTDSLDKLGFQLVGYGCTTCIGNSGPLPDEISAAIHEGNLSVTSVLSGNRNFEGRIHSDVKANYLASPPLVIAYALAGNMQVDITTEPLGEDSHGKPVYLKDIWPSNEQVQSLVDTNVTSDLFSSKYASVYDGGDVWESLPVSEGARYAWPDSSYVRKPGFFDDMPAEAPETADIEHARCLLKLGDSVTTDHISPAGSIAPDSPAAQYLKEQGVEPKDFNSYGSRRGNHEVMMRGTFANVRLRNQLAPGTEGGWTRYQPDDQQMTVFDAATRYQQEGVPLIVLAGKEYGTGSSRDWAAKGPLLLGVRAVIAESYERIHRSNLVGMGILPLQFKQGDSADTLGLDGTEKFSINAVSATQKTATVNVVPESGEAFNFEALIRIDTPNEFAYYQSGGILHYVLRQLA
ncbi:aconitate hydratase AcnA [Aestuariibacter salexigens]|uniref:aconitate hydratase AcnA n=1 Tax=Aestuariibacter salexigens TaxID=226010 RepID=UPI00040F5034|nr:aconitate hydratase AcnA [Aestuariibacter salexigens]